MRVGTRKLCNLVLAWCMKHIKAEEVEEWLYQMDLPLPGEVVTAKASASELDKDAELFMAALKAKKGG